jgi:hypothetical protein
VTKPGVLYVLGLLVAPLAGMAIYVHGLWVGHMLDLRPLDEFCSGKPPAITPTSWSYIPLPNRCEWSDGTSTNLVPAYVNSTLLACVVGAAICVVLARRAKRQNRDAMGADFRPH